MSERRGTARKTDHKSRKGEEKKLDVSVFPVTSDENRERKGNMCRVQKMGTRDNRRKKRESRVVGMRSHGGGREKE